MPVFRNFNQKELDAQYNVRAGISNHLEIFSRWKVEGEKFRSENFSRLDLKYGRENNQNLDYFESKHPRAPLLVFIHGGYWQSLDKSDFSPVAAPYLEKGIDVAVINYRLAPMVSMENIVDDNRNALKWLYDHAAELGFDRNRLYVSGHSAGGHLTAVMASTNWASLGYPADIVKGGCAISGLHDLEPIRLCYLNKALGLDRRDVERFSPLRKAERYMVPLILTVGGDESPEYFRLQGEFESRLRSDDALIEVVAMQGGHHFDAVDALGDRSSALAASVIRMIQG